MTNENARTESFRLIRCYVGDESYGLDMSWVHSIQRTDRLRFKRIGDRALNEDPSQPPFTSGDIVGWLDVEGNETPVFRLASLLGRSSERAQSLGGQASGDQLQRVIVLHPSVSSGEEGEAGSWGLLVDRVSQVLQIPMDLVVPLPAIVLDPRTAYFKGVIWLPEDMVLLLSIENLLSGSAQRAGLDEDRDEMPITEATSGDDASRLERLTWYEPDSDTQRAGPGQIVVFNLHKQFQGPQTLSFGLSISQVPEILEPLPMIPVPGAPAFVMGLLRWRYRPVPLIDLASRLKMSVEEEPSTNGNIRLIVVRDRMLGLQASSLPRGADKEGGVGSRHAQGVMAAFMIQPAVRILRLPIACQPYVEELPFERAMMRGVVTTESEVLAIPDVQSVLRRGT